MRKNKKKNSIQIMVIIEILIKKKKKNMLTKNLTCYQFMESYLN